MQLLLKSFYCFSAITLLVLILLAAWDNSLLILHPRDVGTEHLHNLRFDLNYWRSRPALRNSWKTFTPLSTPQVIGVEKLLFFTGYPRSGHSIVGSLLDAHPNIILSHRFFLFRGLTIPSGKEKSIEGLLQNKTAFFNTMYELSHQYSLVSRDRAGKGYTLDVPGMWSGRFNGTLKVIGDRSASATTSAYCVFSKEKFKKMYNHLAECANVELVAVHVVRNPFDMIATHALYNIMNDSWKKQEMKSKAVINESMLERVAEFYFRRAKAVKEMVPLCNMKIIEVHSEDLIESPRKQLLRLCSFLDVHCSEEYLKICEKKVFPEVSRTRDKIVWPPDVKAKVLKRMQKFHFFRGYSFHGNLYNSL